MATLSAAIFLLAPFVVYRYGYASVTLAGIFRRRLGYPLSFSRVHSTCINRDLCTASALRHDKRRFATLPIGPGERRHRGTGVSARPQGRQSNRCRAGPSRRRQRPSINNSGPGCAVPFDAMFARAATPREASSAFEVEVARRLFTVGAPVGALESRAEPRVYLQTKARCFVLDSITTALVLRSHAGHAQAPFTITMRIARDRCCRTPNATDRVAVALRELADRTQTPELPDPDRDFLVDALKRIGCRQ